MTVSGRWNDTDIPHVVAENLQLRGQAGNAILDPNNVLPTPQQGNFIARFDARLRIDPGTIVKLDGAVIEAGIGSQLIAEGIDGKEVVFTSVMDDTFGGSGTFDTSSDGFFGSRPSPGDWGGIYLGFLSSGSIDHALISYGGGTAPVEGSFTGYNAIGVHQADLRLTNSTLTQNAGGKGGQAPETRFGRTSNEEAAIFVRQAQPILINNIIEDTTSLSGAPAAAISINVASLNSDRIVDYGRSTGRSATFPNHIDNQGPLIVGNRIGGNDVNGMLVRGGTLTTEGVWDDQDIVHLVFDEIAVPNYHTSGGLRLESNPAQSLVVKLNGPSAGFTAGGRTLDIDDRIGGSLLVVGHPNFPVVLTSTADNTVGAGRTPDGLPNLRVFDGVSTPNPGDWRSIRLTEFSNDRNLDTVIEYEPTDIDFDDSDNPRNNAPITNAQFLGRLARNLKSGDENLRLGFDIHGTIARPNDADTYSFQAEGGTEVWFDIDHTTDAFDSVIELVTADGFVLASSDSSHSEANPFNHSDAGRPFVNARNLSKTGYYPIDHYSINPRDPGFRVQLPAEGINTYHIRVRSTGDSAGAYELQIRMSEVDEVPGSTIKFADIRYATNGIELQGVPRHSPLLGEVAELNQANNEFVEAQAVGNVLNSDRGAISVAGELVGAGDVDWYQFDVSYEGTQSGGGYASIALDLDYADGVSGANMSFAVYTDDGRLVAFGDESNIADDLNAPAQGADIDDLTRGSAGPGDPFIGPLSVPDGSYYVAVFPDTMIPREMAKFLQRDLLEEFPNEVHRYLPNDALTRVAQDFGDGAGPLLFEAVPTTLNETKFFITTPTNLNTANAFTGSAEYVYQSFANNRTIGDFDVRPEDGWLFTLAAQPPASDENSGLGVRIDQVDGSLGAAFDDEIMTNGVMTYFGEADPDSGEITVEEANVGLTYEAVGYGLGKFWGVGNRNDAGAVQGTETLAYEENILYRHDYFDLTAEPTEFERSTDSPNGDPAPDIPMDGPWTQIVDRGFIDTVNSTAGDVRLIVQNEATLLGPNFFVDDGDAFSAAGTNFEMEAGVQISLTEQQIRDGDILRMTVGAFTHDFQFDTGPVLALAVPSTDDGATFSFGNSTFEYDDNGNVAGNNIPVDITGAGTVATLAQRIVDAAPAAGLTAGFYADGAGVRITFAGDTGAPGTTVPVTGNLGGIFEGEYGGVDGNGDSLCDPTSNCIVVGVEETDTIDQLMAAISSTYVGENLGTIDRVGSAFGRMNFLDGDAASFVERNTNGSLNAVDVVTASAGVSPGATAIEFLASDTREDIADKITAAIPGAINDTPDSVFLSAGFDSADDPPFRLTGPVATGGLVTGIAFVNDIMFAVSDTGGLFRIDAPDIDGVPVGPGITTTFVASLGVNFTGVTAGPLEMQDGAFAETLFGIDDQGAVHAFDINGIPQPVFADGATFVETEIMGANGIGFSNYQENFWHIESGEPRADDVGHGVVTPVTEIPQGGFQNPDSPLDDKESPGGDAFYFGERFRDVQNGRQFDNVEVFNYDKPGGARGSLLSEPFSLFETDSADEPFLYFNYLLDTEGANREAGEQSDSFRVYLQDDAGNFHLLATNNNRRDNGDFDEFDCDDPLCGGSTNNDANYGRVQELFDNFEGFHLNDDGTDLENPSEWRQARISLRQFAGQEQLRVRFDFSTEGGLNDARLPGDEFGRYTGVAPDDRLAGVVDNTHEGAWLDDIIIGFAERGELITGEHRDGANEVAPRIVPNLAVPDMQIEQGRYQLEIRRSREYNAQAVIDTNDRLSRSVFLLPNAAADLNTSGDSFTLSNGLREFVFEFLEAGQDSTIDGAVPVEYQPNATRNDVAAAIVTAINTLGPDLDMNFTAETTRGQLGAVNIHGETVIIISQGDLLQSRVFDDVGDTNRVREQGHVLVNSNYVRDALEYGIRVESGTRLGDSNQAIPHPGSAINHVEANEQQLAPGATVMNNVIIRGGMGGILVDGDAYEVIIPGEDDQPDVSLPVVSAPVPFARIINNTVVGATLGANNGIGINVQNNASPTLLNNILSSLEVGIQIDASSSTSVVGGSLFQNVDSIPVLGDFAIQLGLAQPLFVDPFNDNFFPAEGSLAIDSSVDSLNDRDELVSVRNPLGIDLSPILAPVRDASGQLRVDDPDVEGFGQGADVFVDRGALDRSDFFGPTATLIGPRDNDPDGIDENPANNDVSVVEDPDNPLSEFVIQLFDTGGADSSLGGFGVDDFSVISDAVLFFRGDDMLVEGVDYSFEYDSTNNQIRLVPASGVWTQGAYRIELTAPIRDLFGNPLVPNRPGGSTIFNINVGSAIFDFGDAPAPYPSAESDNGARHSLQTDLFLGSVISTESAPREMDDDDGIDLQGQFVPGTNVSIVATASKAARLDGWIDFNGDGDWDDAGEQILAAADVVAGENTFTLDIPMDAIAGMTYGRFRLSEQGGLLPTGEVSGGEVEDYEIQILAQGTDLGDAPSPYPTVLADDGAVHNIVPGFFLGQGVDGESDASPNEAADSDSDDGVTITGSFVLAFTSTVTIHASAAGSIDAWIDWNQDGDWLDAGEQVFTSQSVQAGDNDLALAVPTDVTLGTTYARFRFSSTGGLSPTGVAGDGEVEDYQVSVTDSPVDFGDAPDPSFPTLLANDGARHTVIAGYQLGDTVGAEADGLPGQLADGDVGDDGVVFGALIPGRDATISVNASGQGRIDAWFDFNGDGDWDDAGEQVFASEVVTEGVNQLMAAVPDTAIDGQVHARFRFSTTGGLSPSGRAFDGEVEDYLVLIQGGSSWHNLDIPEDVDANGVITPLDANIVITELNQRMISNDVTGLLPPPDAPPFYDVNNDGFVSPLDAILIINRLSSAASPAAPLSAGTGFDPRLTDGSVENLETSLENQSARAFVFADLDQDPDRNKDATDQLARLWMGETDHESTDDEEFWNVLA